jgi:hypothetical protein
LVVAIDVLVRLVVPLEDVLTVIEFFEQLLPAASILPMVG